MWYTKISKAQKSKLREVANYIADMHAPKEYVLDEIQKGKIQWAQLYLDKDIKTCSETVKNPSWMFPENYILTKKQSTLLRSNALQQLSELRKLRQAVA